MDPGVETAAAKCLGRLLRGQALSPAENALVFGHHLLTVGIDAWIERDGLFDVDAMVRALEHLELAEEAAALEVAMGVLAEAVAALEPETPEPIDDPLLAALVLPEDEEAEEPSLASADDRSRARAALDGAALSRWATSLAVLERHFGRSRTLGSLVPDRLRRVASSL